MTTCERAGLGLIDDGTLPKDSEFLALCVCGRTVTVTNGQIEWHDVPAPWDDPAGCFGHCDREGWYAPCVSRTNDGCSNPDCPLDYAHAGPCAPKGWFAPTHQPDKPVLTDPPVELPLCAGWTLGLRREAGHIYLDWHRTGSQDPHLPHLSPDEAVDLANILLALAPEGEAA